jgi:cytochrome c biogenesis protein
MYHSWWFSAILLLLVINLISCSLHRLPGVWSQIFPTSKPGELDDSILKTLPFVEKIKIQNQVKTMKEDINICLKRWLKNKNNLFFLGLIFPMMISLLFSLIIELSFLGFIVTFLSWTFYGFLLFIFFGWFRVKKDIETDSAVTIYLEKGRFSRLGVYIVHLSILIIVIGGLMGSFYGFKGFVNILEGETVDQIYLRVKDEKVSKSIGFSVRCDDFNITYYDLPGRKEKYVKEYTSHLTILENGKEVLKKTVQVNHPLHYKGLAFYQSSYGAIHNVTLGIQWKGKKEKTVFQVMEGNTSPIPNSNNLIRVLKAEHQVHSFGEGVQVVLFKPNQEPRPFWLLKSFPKFDEQRKDEFILTFEGFTEKEYTGLSVTKDPGVNVVYLGCYLLVFWGLVVSFFFSHQRVWVRIPKSPGGEIVLAGTTNKNRVGFEKTFGQLVEGVRSLGKK